MSEPAVKIESLGKKYKIGTKHQQVDDTLKGWLATHLYKLKNPKQWRFAQEAAHNFWALKDISLEINRGDKIGLIGQNGSGKSTLLKILSRITEPTEGQVTIHGRVSSLLEVGTGFHPDLTGRENIFLYGTIMGMAFQEVKRKFDAIVDFSGIEKFLDTPVKRYSSGMLARLGFAVAAHLDSEILIVDEALAVGDFEFQKKCLTKMNDIAQKQARTIIFVSHGLDAIKTVCNQGILLNQGRLVCIGDIDSVIEAYNNVSSANHQSEYFWHSTAERKLQLANDFFDIDAIYLTNRQGQKILGFIDDNDNVRLVIDVHVKRAGGDICYILSRNFDEVMISCTHDFGTAHRPKALDRLGAHQLSIDVPMSQLSRGDYSIGLAWLGDDKFDYLIHPDIHVFAPKIFFRKDYSRIVSDRKNSIVISDDVWQSD